MRFGLLFILMLTVSAVHAQYYAVNGDSTKTGIEIPATVVTSFRKIFPIIPRDTIVRWIADGQEGSYSYAVNVGFQGAVFDALGLVEQTFLEVQMTTLPRPVQRRIQKSILRGWRQVQPGIIRAYLYETDGDPRYYVIQYCDPLHEKRKCDSLIEPNGNYYNYNPKFR